MFSFLAALGALITIMASFNGFASQQLIQLVECQQLNNTAMVALSRTNSYAASGKRNSAEIYDSFLPMDVAVEVGILQPVQDYTNVLASGCITGNCSFPSSDGAAFSTLAISHSCEDVTSEVEHIPLNTTYTSSNGTEVTIPEIVNLENDTSIQNSNFTLFLDDEFTNPIGLPVSGRFNLITGVSGLMYNGSIATIKMIHQTDKWGDPLRYQAISCSLLPSVNTYAVAYDKTVLKETLLSSVVVGQNLNTTEYQVWWKLATSHTLRNGSRELCDRRKTPSPGFAWVAAGNIDASPRNISSSTDISQDLLEAWYMPEDCVWTFLHPGAYGIRSYLETIFDHQQYGIGPKYLLGTSHLKRLDNNGSLTIESVDGFMKNMTTSMTAVIRTHGLSGQNAQGTILYTTTCIRISWTWISYPAVMIGLPAIFLLLVHLESRDVESERLWKSSTLATLFCEMDDAVIDSAKPLRKGTMQDTADSTSVCLDRNATTLRLVAR
jgi:hypothetical protein